ncbi:MAG: response regulator [Bacteroidetes bacterium]|nr:response regulator [Bacteroidota bacterium]
MKIWVKIALLVFIVTNVVLEIVLFFVKNEITKEYTRLEGRNLQTLASSISTSIDGEYFKMVDFSDTSKVYNNQHYQHLQSSLKKIKKKLNLPQEIYTLSMIDSDHAIFGIMTNEVPFSGDTLELKSDVAKKCLLQVYETKKSMHTGIYEDQYGMWITGMAPIIDNDGNVVGVVQADHKSSYVQAKIDENNKYFLYFRIILIPFLILISIIASKFISKPITQLTKAIDNISKGNYKKVKNIKATGELKLLVNSTNRMRETILEQQEKIQENIRELTDSNEKLKTAKEKAEEINRLKSNFLANMSHELRTPLVGILGFAEIIEEEIEDPELKKLTGFILEDQQRLLNTVDSILDLSVIEANKKEVNYEPVNLVEKANNTFIRYKKAADKKNLDLSVSIKKQPDPIKADRKLLAQVLNNLVDNAIKFTKQGEVKIVIDEKEINDIKYGVVRIIDSGIGIPQDCINFIFEEFRQLSEGLSRNFEGVGLGLTITKNFVELMNGRIEVKSKVNKGSEFCVMFPVYKKSELNLIKEKTQKINEIKESDKPRQNNGKILLVEDNDSSIELIKKFLGNNYQLDFCSDGETAILKVKEKAYSLIIMDIKLEGKLNGLETAKKISEIDNYKNIPIVALTAYAMKGDEKKILSGACTQYISKPFNKQTLISTINTALECSANKTNQ